METLLDSARSAAALAHQARHGGNVTNAARLFTSSAVRFLSIAVTDCARLEEAVAFANQEAISIVLTAAAQTTEDAIRDVASGKVPRTALTGRYVFLALSHFAALLGAHEPATTFCRVAQAPEVTGTPFWDAYADCYGKFLVADDFDLPVLSVRGSEEYWLPYLGLMKAIGRQEPIEATVELLRTLFLKRNRDKRFLPADAHQIEGTVNRPANWDFRLAALLARNPRSKGP